MRRSADLGAGSRARSDATMQPLYGRISRCLAAVEGRSGSIPVSEVADLDGTVRKARDDFQSYKGIFSAEVLCH